MQSIHPPRRSLLRIIVHLLKVNIDVVLPCLWSGSSTVPNGTEQLRRGGPLGGHHVERRLNEPPHRGQCFRRFAVPVVLIIAIAILGALPGNPVAELGVGLGG